MKSTARIAGVFYALVFVLGMVSFATGNNYVVSGDPAATAAHIRENPNGLRIAWLINTIVTASYLVVTALLYELFKPVNRNLSLTAALFSLTGCIVGVAHSMMRIATISILQKTPRSSDLDAVAYALLRLAGGNTTLVFFGVYCTLIGWLIAKSNLMPRFVGFFMIAAGLGWLTFLWPPIVTPFSFVPGIIGEGVLTVWLLVKGVDEDSVAIDNLARAHA